MLCCGASYITTSYVFIPSTSHHCLLSPKHALILFQFSWINARNTEGYHTDNRTKSNAIPNMSPESQCPGAEERQNFKIHEDPDCREGNDPSQENPNARSNTNAETKPGPQANMEHPAGTNVPETPSTSTATEIGRMVLASTRQPVALATENFIRGDNDDEVDPPTPSRAEGHNATDDNENSGIAARSYSGVVLDRASLDNPEPSIPLGSHDLVQVSFANIINTGEISSGIESITGEQSFGNPPQTPIGHTRRAPFQTPSSRTQRSQSPGARLLTTRTPIPAHAVRSLRGNGNGVGGTPVARRLFQDTNSPARTFNFREEPRLFRPLISDTPRRQTSAPGMPPPQTLASRMRTSHISTPARSLRGHDNGVGGTPVTRRLFQDPSSPAPNDNAREPQPFRSLIPNSPLRASLPRSVSLSDRNEDTEMASPRAITPEDQTVGSPPTPPTPITSISWIHPSLMTPETAARTIVQPPYRNRDEQMEMTPSPPRSHASPKDEEMDDTFGTPCKPKTSSNVPSPVKNATAPKPAPMESAAPVYDNVTQDPAPIENSASVEDAAGPNQTTITTVIRSREIEITTTVMKTPSPPETPTSVRRTTANLRLSAATPRKAGHAPSHEAASAPQCKGKGGAQQKKHRRRTADQIVASGINRRQELRTSTRYSLRESTRGVVPGTYSSTPARNKTSGSKICPKK